MLLTMITKGNRFKVVHISTQCFHPILSIETLEQSIVNFEHISHIVLVVLLLTLSR